MTEDKVKAWAIAEMKANATLRSLLGSPFVFSQRPTLPSGPGVFVGIITGAGDTQWSDLVTLQITVCSTTSEAYCYRLCDAVFAAMHAVPGQPKTWAANPSAYSLRLKSIERAERATVDSEKNEAKQTLWLGVQRYRVKGADVTLLP